MQIGMHAQSHVNGSARSQMMGMPERSDRSGGTEQTSRSERIVARHDADEDGQLSIAELSKTKLGSKMSIEQFANLDANGDTMLDAGELEARRPNRPPPPDQGANASNILAQFADQLSAQVAKEGDRLNEVAARVIQNLDSDESGALNSEEIAGTQLAQIIGDEFYDVDADKSGTLNQEELANFLVDHLTGGPKESAQTTEDAEVSGAAAIGVNSGVDSVSDTVEEIDIEPAEVETAAATTSSNSTDAARSDSIRAAFQAALDLLQNGSGSISPYDHVKALYSNVQDIMAA